MPKIPNTLVKPSGIFQFNMRYPKPLVEAGLVATEFKRKSLGTRDWRDAKKKAAFERAAFVLEVEKLESQLGRNLHDSAKPKTPLSAFSSKQRDDLVIRWFISMECDAQKMRDRFDSENDEWQERVFDSAFHELQTCEGRENSGYAQIDWEREVREKLELEEISFDQEEDKKEIEALAILYRKAKIEIHWRTLEHMDGRPFRKRDGLFERIHANSEPPTQVSTRTLANLCEEFISAKVSAGRSPSTLKKHRYVIRILSEYFGDGTFLDSFAGDPGYEKAKRFTQFLSVIPVSSKSKYHELSIVKASQLEEKTKTPRFIAPRTQREIFIDVKAIFGVAVTRGWIPSNPFAGLQESLPTEIKRPPLMLSGEDLTTLLSSKEFLKERNRRKGRFWSVILCLFHGMRLNEAASLLVGDIKKQDGVWFLDVTEFDDQGNPVKRLKNQVSRRRVPIHEQVIKIGFLDYVKGRSGKDDWLFDDVKPDTLGNRGGHISKWFTRIRNKVIGRQPKKGDKSIHSLRHAAADAIRSVTDSDEILYEIGGWGNEKSANSSRRYGKGDLKRLKRVVDQIEFEGFDTSVLIPQSG